MSAPIASWLDLRLGDALTVLGTLPEQSVSCCVTSPPYWGQRDYGVEGQYGLESTPEAYLDQMVAVFAEVRRVLRQDGTLWLNMGDSYSSSPPGNKTNGVDKWRTSGLHGGVSPRYAATLDASVGKRRSTLAAGLKPKDLVGMPWMLALALRADGWWLRSDIIWSKPACMPESVTDRPTKAHEYLFLLAKNERYFYDADAIRTPLRPKTFTTFGIPHQAQGNDGSGNVKSDNWGRTVKERQPKLKREFAGKNSLTDVQAPGRRVLLNTLAAREASGSHDDPFAGANKRTVWEVAVEPYPDAHFATFPTALVAPCILAGCPEGGVVLDPFLGSGTTALVANRLGRRALGIELNPLYLEMAQKRCSQTTVWEAEARR